MIFDNQVIAVLLLGLCLSISAHHGHQHHDDEETTKKVVQIEVGEHCDLGAAPDSDGKSWHVVEHNVEKVIEIQIS